MATTEQARIQKEGWFLVGLPVGIVCPPDDVGQQYAQDQGGPSVEKTKGEKSPVAFSESLAACIRDTLTRKKGVEEKKMFGGVGFLLHGNMLVGVWKDSLIVRLGEEQGDEALLEPHFKTFDITGRAMKGWVLVAPEGVKDDQLKDRIQRAVKFVGTLPAR